MFVYFSQFFSSNEQVLLCKNVFSGYQKVPRSPTPSGGKTPKSDGETKRKHFGVARDEGELPVRVLADVDSLFIQCQGVTLHYKLSLPGSPLRSLSSTTFLDSDPSGRSSQIAMGRPTPDKHLLHLFSKGQYNLHRSYSNQFHSSSLYAPLLDGSTTSPVLSEEIPPLSLDAGKEDEVRNMNSPTLEKDLEGDGQFGIVLVHGFGGGVFSWRHVMGVLARQVGCRVAAFDRPGWGLTSRLRREDWEENEMPNPYKLDSQVIATDLLYLFCFFNEL